MNNKEVKFLLGSDPELFLKRRVKGVLDFFSPEGLLTGTKTEPEWIDENKQRGILLDNVSLEFLTAPSGNKRDFVDEHKFMMNYVKTAMSAYKLVVSEDSVAEFNDKYLSTANATEFGCSESFNARTGKVNVMPDASISKKRSCGGHLHVSVDDYDMTFEDCIDITRIMDLYLGVPSVIMSKDTERRNMFYGKAGEFRWQRERYLEYRSLDNFWLFDEKYMEWAWAQTERALVAWRNGFRVDNKLYDIIELTINKYDKASANVIIDKFNLNIT